MEHKNFPRVYPYSLAESKRLDEVADWQASHKENIRCKEFIEDSIRKDFDGIHLGDTAIQDTIAEFGYHRTGYVLQNSLQELKHDGRFSHENKEWAERVYIPKNKANGRNPNLEFMVNSHPAVLDGFVNQFRRAYQELGLFEQKQCLPDTMHQDFEGKVIAIHPSALDENYLTQKDQLWLAESGFGCNPNSSGRAVYARCLSDGEKARWNRSQVLGVVEEQNLPQWAVEKLQELRNPEQSQQENQALAPTMTQTM